MDAKELCPPSSQAEEQRVQVPSTDNYTKEESDAGEGQKTYPSLTEFWFGVQFSDDEGLDADVGTVCHFNSDSDSDSDSYEKLEPGERCMTEAEKAEYERQIEESKGFDIERLENVGYAGITPLHPILINTDPTYERLAKETVELLNKKWGKSFELDRIVKVNLEWYYCGFNYYFTLMLTDQIGSKRIYRAKVKSDNPGHLELLFEEEVNSHEYNSGTSKGDKHASGATGKRSFGTMDESEAIQGLPKAMKM